MVYLEQRQLVLPTPSALHLSRAPWPTLANCLPHRNGRTVCGVARAFCREQTRLLHDLRISETCDIWFKVDVDIIKST